MDYFCEHLKFLLLPGHSHPVPDIYLLFTVVSLLFLKCTMLPGTSKTLHTGFSSKYSSVLSVSICLPHPIAKLVSYRGNLSCMCKEDEVLFLCSTVFCNTVMLDTLSRCFCTLSWGCSPLPPSLSSTRLCISMVKDCVLLMICIGTAERCAGRVGNTE